MYFDLIKLVGEKKMTLEIILETNINPFLDECTKLSERKGFQRDRISRFVSSIGNRGVIFNEIDELKKELEDFPSRVVAALFNTVVIYAAHDKKECFLNICSELITPEMIDNLLEEFVIRSSKSYQPQFEFLVNRFPLLVKKVTLTKLYSTENLQTIVMSTNVKTLEQLITIFPPEQAQLSSIVVDIIRSDSRRAKDLFCECPNIISQCHKPILYSEEIFGLIRLLRGGEFKVLYERYFISFPATYNALDEYLCCFFQSPENHELCQDIIAKYHNIIESLSEKTFLVLFEKIISSFNAHCSKVASLTPVLSIESIKQFLANNSTLICKYWLRTKSLVLVQAEEQYVGSNSLLDVVLQNGQYLNKILLDGDRIESALFVQSLARMPMVIINIANYIIDAQLTAEQRIGIFLKIIPQLEKQNLVMVLNQIKHEILKTSYASCSLDELKGVITEVEEKISKPRRDSRSKSIDAIEHYTGVKSIIADNITDFGSVALAGLTGGAGAAVLAGGKVLATQLLRGVGQWVWNMGASGAGSKNVVEDLDKDLDNDIEIVDLQESDLLSSEIYTGRLVHPVTSAVLDEEYEGKQAYVSQPESGRGDTLLVEKVEVTKLKMENVRSLLVTTEAHKASVVPDGGEEMIAPTADNIEGVHIEEVNSKQTKDESSELKLDKLTVVGSHTASIVAERAGENSFVTEGNAGTSADGDLVAGFHSAAVANKKRNSGKKKNNKRR
jgi:hypothetical protein